MLAPLLFLLSSVTLFDCTDTVIEVNQKITINSLCTKFFFGTIRFFRRSIMKSHGGYKLKTKNKNSQNRNAAMVGGIRVGRAKPAYPPR
jgi:hypothetical protein